MSLPNQSRPSVSKMSAIIRSNTTTIRVLKAWKLYRRSTAIPSCRRVPERDPCSIPNTLAPPHAVASYPHLGENTSTGTRDMQRVLYSQAVQAAVVCLDHGNIMAKSPHAPLEMPLPAHGLLGELPCQTQVHRHVSILSWLWLAIALCRPALPDRRRANPSPSLRAARVHTLVCTVSPQTKNFLGQTLVCTEREPLSATTHGFVQDRQQSIVPVEI
mmetsp:Transcript_103209/g.301019  ORF Transcript_103209/g.301019 Transcript_103209/m.301019 type:complete len:216 (+) Transcript_103209:52-699(+)